MKSPDTYRTIKQPSEGVFRERGSKFLAFAYPVKSEEEIGNILGDLRKKYHDARHHCFAYRLGSTGQVSRVNDDGEPSGSAGMPILGQIRSHDLSNVLIVVVRYFGGIKLGVGGLIHAYRSAAAEALKHARIVEEIESNTLEILFPYQRTNDIMKIIEDEHLVIEDQEYTDTCRLRARVPRSSTDRVLERINKLPGVEAKPVG